MSGYVVHWPEGRRDANGCLPSYLERPANHDWRQSDPFDLYQDAEAFAFAKVFELGELGQTWNSLCVKIAEGNAVVAVAKSVLWCSIGPCCEHCNRPHRYKCAEGYSPHFTPA